MKTYNPQYKATRIRQLEHAMNQPYFQKENLILSQLPLQHAEGKNIFMTCFPKVGIPGTIHNKLNIPLGSVTNTNISENVFILKYKMSINCFKERVITSTKCKSLHCYVRSTLYSTVYTRISLLQKF